MAKSRHQNGYLTVSSKLKVKDATSLFDFLFKVLLIIKYILLVQNKQITLMDIPLWIPSMRQTIFIQEYLYGIMYFCGIIWYQLQLLPA